MTQSVEEQELQELAELEELAELDALAAQESGDEEESLPPQPEQDSIARSVGLGAVEGVPFLKDAAAGVETLIEGGTEDFGERFNKNQEEWNDAINKSEGDNPVAFATGDIGAGIASSFVLPGGFGLKSAVALGAASGVSRSEDRDATDALFGGIVGAGGYGVGKVLSKGVSTLGHHLGIFGKKGVLEGVGGIRPGTREAINKHVDRAYMQVGMNKDKAIVKMADDILKSKADDGMGILKHSFQALDVTAKRSSEAKNRIGKEIGKILGAADDKVGKVDSEVVYNKLAAKLGVTDEMIEGVQSVEKKKLLLQIKAKLDTQFIDKFKPRKIGVTKISQEGMEKEIENFVQEPVFSKMRLKDLHQLKSEMGEMLSKKIAKAKGGGGVSDISDDMLLKHLGTLSDVIEEQVEKSGIETASQFHKLNRQWSSLNLVQDIATKEAHKTFGGPFEKLQGLLGTKGLILGGISTTIGASRTAAAGVTLAVNELLTNPGTPGALAQGLLKLNNFISLNPDHAFVKRMITASAVSSESLRASTEGIISELNIIEGGKLKRSVDDVLTKSDDLLQSLQYHSPEMATQLRKAIQADDKETIGALMDQLAKNPETKAFIEDGEGWDGKVYTPEDKARIESQVESMDISQRQRLKHKKALRDSGVIPVLQSEPDRFFKAKGRDKSKPSF